MWDIGLVLSIIGVGISILSLYLSSSRTTKEDTKRLENRLTRLEGNQFKPEDRECLHEVEVKMNLFWSIVEKEFPRVLMKQRTPVLDLLLEKAEINGVSNLTEIEQDQLLDGLNQEYDRALETEDSGRAMAISLFRATLIYNKNHGEKKCLDSPTSGSDLV